MHSWCTEGCKWGHPVQPEHILSWSKDANCGNTATLRRLQQCYRPRRNQLISQPTSILARHRPASRVPANRRLAVQIRQNLASPRCDRWLYDCGRGDPEGDGVRNHRGIARAGRVIHRPDPDGDLCGDRQFSPAKRKYHNNDCGTHRGQAEPDGHQWRSHSAT